MPQFFVTFGQQHHREPHPTFPDAHPDGWVTIVAPDKQTARRVAHERLGRVWAFMYDENDWRPQYFPRGRLALWEAE